MHAQALGFQKVFQVCARMNPGHMHTSASGCWQACTTQVVTARDAGPQLPVSACIVAADMPGVWPSMHARQHSSGALTVSSAISMVAPSQVPRIRQPFIWNFMLEVPEASVPAVLMCWDSSAPAQGPHARTHA